MGLKVENVAPGKATISMTVRPEMIGLGDVCGRGAIFLLADSTLAFAANTRGHRVVAQHCDIVFDNSVGVGEVLVADASERHTSRRKGMYDVRVQTRAGKVVAELRGHTHTLEDRLVAPVHQPKP
jgi:acyl-CoA thioesterase